VWLWLGAPLINIMSGLNLAIHWHGRLLQSHNNIHYVYVEVTCLLLLMHVCCEFEEYNAYVGYITFMC
jgi:hypothetical protein